MELLPLVCLCLLTCSGTTFADESLIIKVTEGSDVTLPCSFITTKDIRAESFDWKKDGEKDVFLYEGFPLSGQDPQFKGRVSLSDEELKNGDASITIKNTKVNDTGDYTCFFPSIELTRHIMLRVEPLIIKVTEGSDVTLPCSFNTTKDIRSKSFLWEKDGEKVVFLYEGSPLTRQDPQFKGRVSLSDEELKNGDASITIKNTKVNDTGDYTCYFPRIRLTRHIMLRVDGPLKDRTKDFPGAAAKPVIIILDEIKNGVQLQCEVHASTFKPHVQWQDTAGNILPAEEPQVSERGGSYDIILQTTVTKTDRYRCVATQEEIRHQIYTETYVFVRGTPTGWIVLAAVLGAVFVVVILVVLIKKGLLTPNCNRGPSAKTRVPPEDPSDSEK